MDSEEKLIANDYYNLPFKELVAHPDFSSDAFEKVAKFASLTTEEIEKIDIPSTREPK